MPNYSRLLELNEIANIQGKTLSVRRDLFRVIELEAGKHLVGIVGPRGAGKTVMLRQMAAIRDDAFYLSTDTLDAQADLFQIVKDLSERYAYRIFLLDEIHFLSGSVGALKQIHDFLSVRVIFTSSVALALHASAHDLARRVRLHTLDYFSFREYLHFRHGEIHERLTLEQLLSAELPPATLRAGRHFADYISGGLLPFALDEPDPLPLLSGTLEKIIERDIPMTLRLHLDEIPILRKLLSFVGRSAVEGINYSTLSANLGITKYKAEQYAAAFEAAFVLRRIFPAGTNVLREPKVLLIPPIRLLHRTLEEAAGGLREDFFAIAMRQASIDFSYLKGTRGEKTPDFLVEHNGQHLALEIGGRGKGRSQFKGVQADRKIIFSPDAAPTKDRLPLHLLGLLA